MNGPIPGNVPGRVGWGFEKPGLVGGVAGSCNRMLFEVPFNSNHSVQGKNSGWLLKPPALPDLGLAGLIIVAKPNLASGTVCNSVSKALSLLQDLR